MTKRIVVLGVSTFSDFVLRYLHESKRAETIAVDRDEERINAIADLVDRPIIGNIRNRELLEQLDLGSADMVLVSLGDIEGSLVTVLYLKELNVSRLMVKALNAEHEHILRLLGVQSIVFPEREMAKQVAFRLVYPHVLDSLTIDGGERIVEYATPESLIGRELDRKKLYEDYAVQLLMVIDCHGAPNPLLPDVHTVQGGDRLVLYGSDDALYAFQRATS